MNKKIDIIMISDLKKTSGGRESWFYNFTTKLYKLSPSYKIVIFASTKGIKIDNVKVNDVNINDIGKSRCPRSFEFLLKYTKTYFHNKKDVDVAISVGGIFEALCLIINYRRRNFKGVKVAWIRSIFSLEKNITNKVIKFFILKVEKKIYSNIDFIITNGPDTGAFYAKLGVNNIVINNAIDLTLWKESNKFLNEKINICYVGRLSDVKGIKFFLDSIRLFKKIDSELFNKFVFNIVGPGCSKIINIIDDMQNDKMLKYHGSIDNDKLSKFLVNMDCSVGLTLLDDNFGGAGISNALIEQMSSGLLMITWENEIFNQVVSDKSAIMVEQGSVEGLVNAYKETLDFSKNKTIIRESIKLSKKYDINVHVKRFLEQID